MTRNIDNVCGSLKLIKLLDIKYDKERPKNECILDETQKKYKVYRKTSEGTQLSDNEN
jgi:hypothetical protein